MSSVIAQAHCWKTIDRIPPALGDPSLGFLKILESASVIATSSVDDMTLLDQMWRTIHNSPSLWGRIGHGIFGEEVGIIAVGATDVRRRYPVNRPAPPRPAFVS